MDNPKEILNKKLIDQHFYWSFNMNVDTQIPDDILIEKALLYLDIDDINKLFTLFPYKKIKQIWRDRLVIQGDYYRKLNKLLAWMYFDIKNPDKYINRTMHQHLDKFT
jgi:hypothetical protein